MNINKFTYTEYAKEEHEKLNTIKEDIECASCEKLLVRSIQIKDIKKEMNYKFTCPFCGGKSFLKKFNYQAFFEPVLCKIDNIDYKEGEKLCLVNLKNL